MKKALTIGLVAAALAATLPFVFAGSNSEAVTEADAVPAYEIVRSVRAMRLNPTAEPSRQGAYYVLNAIDPRGVEVRVVADARFGDILSVAPVRTANIVPSYQRGPRIIQVPQNGERNARASVNDRDDPDVYNNDDDDVAPPPPRRVAPPVRNTPRWPPRREASPPPKPPRRAELPKSRSSDAPAPRPPVPQPPSPRRAVLSAPPPPAEGPTPIRPTPRFRAKAEAGEKFAGPRELSPVTADAPPPGYTPPAAAPHVDDSDASQ